MSDSQKNFWCWRPDIGEDYGALVNAKCPADAAKAYARHRVFVKPRTHHTGAPCSFVVTAQSNGFVSSVS